MHTAVPGTLRTPAPEPVVTSSRPDTPHPDPSTSHLDDVLAAVTAQWPEHRAALEELVRIASISALEEHADDVRRSAELTAELLRTAGLERVRLLEIDGAPPYVTGSWLHAGPQRPTVLLYAHHDVQPAATAQRWSSPPFEPVERDGRLYGRGAADDAAGIVLHAASVRAWLSTRGALPVNVKVIIEGEEEVGSPHLGELLATHGDELRADVIVLADLTNWQVGWPALTTALRGMAEVRVTVRTLERPIHSGMWGGLVPDALSATLQLLAGLHDADGALRVPGFDDDVRPLSDAELAQLASLDADPAQLQADAGMLDGTRFVGAPDHGLLERLWARPTITPTGMDVPRVAEASNTLLSEVTTKLSCRLAPGQDPDRALASLRAHLERSAPFGAEVEVELGERNAAWVMEPSGPVWDAAVDALSAGYGRAPAVIGCGGSIPFVAPFAAAFDGAACLLVGVEDPRSNAHGEDESVHLEDLERACRSQVVLLDALAARVGAGER